MFTRRSLKSLARLALAALLFSQAALATTDCDASDHTAAQAVATGSASTEPTPPCHERGGDELPNTNLCLEQCLSADRSLDVPQVTVYAPPAAPVLVLTAAPAARPLVVERAVLPLVPAAAPPPRILFQTLRI